MADTRFYLYDPKTKSETPIFLSYYLGPNDRLRYYIGEKIKPSQWNFHKGFPKQTKHNAGLVDLCKELSEFVTKTRREYKIKGLSLTSTILKRLLNNRLSVTSKQGFYEWIDMAIEARKKSPNYSAGIIRHYRSWKNKMEEYYPGLQFEDISKEWYKDFTNQLFSKGYESSYVDKLTATLKSFLNEGLEAGVHTNVSYKSKSFSVQVKQTDHIYLTEDELHAIYNHKYPNDYLRNAADLFLVGAFTGLRYQDFSTLDPERDIIEYDGVKMISIRTQKTDQRVSIPIHPLLRFIFDKGMPHAISNQKLNIYLKKIGQLVDLKDPFYRTSYPGGIAKTVRYEKWELMTSHTARRSFASNAFKAGMPVQNIMMITGHKTENAFYKYIRITDQENAKIIHGQEFFKWRLRKV